MCVLQEHHPRCVYWEHSISSITFHTISVYQKHKANNLSDTGAAGGSYSAHGLIYLSSFMYVMALECGLAGGRPWPSTHLMGAVVTRVWPFSQRLGSHPVSSATGKACSALHRPVPFRFLPWDNAPTLLFA